MNGLICLLVFCLLAVTALAALGLCRRLFSHELPEHMATLALLESQAQWERQCAALAAQLTWLVDATPDGSLEQGCTAFCRRHRGFCYCRLSELTKIFGSGAESEKNDCNLSKKQV